jgi:hypothetical protein
MSQIINVGNNPNDGLGDKLRDAFIIVNDNFASIDALLSGSDVLTISQITGLQTALNNIQNQLDYIPGLQTDINSINNTIFTINSTLNSQNSSIADLYTEITNLQTQIYTKIEEAPIDGLEYARKDGSWVVAGGGIYATPSFQEVLQVNALSTIGFQLNDLGTNVSNFSQQAGGWLLDFSNTTGYSFLDANTIQFQTPTKIVSMSVDGIRFRLGANDVQLLYNPSQAINGANFQFPVKNTVGTYTLATTDMIGSTPSLQQVTNVGGSTTNSIQFNTGISGTGSKIITITSAYINLVSLNQGAMQIEWNRILFPSSNNIASPVSLGATGNGGVAFWLPGYKSNFATPQILTTQEDVWVPFTGSSNNINIVKAQAGNTFSTATFYTRGLTSSNQTISITATGSNNNTNWAWDVRTNPNLVVDSLQFNTASTTTGAVGRFVWNDADGTLDLGLKGGNVTLQVGQEQLVRVVNKTATNITLQESAYQAVRVTGAQGQRLKVDLALATTDALSAETIGLVTETIANNQEGFVTISGLVNKINTTGSLQSETWVDGDILYLSPTVAGQITNIKPSAPDHMVIIGYVVYSHAVNGKIFVKVNNGYELDELHNVNIVGATAGQVLTYNGSNGLWENQTPTGGGLTLNEVQRIAFLKI